MHLEELFWEYERIDTFLFPPKARTANNYEGIQGRSIHLNQQRAQAFTGRKSVVNRNLSEPSLGTTSGTHAYLELLLL